jgi:hypothetical protein
MMTDEINWKCAVAHQKNELHSVTLFVLSPEITAPFNCSFCLPILRKKPVLLIKKIKKERSGLAKLKIRLMREKNHQLFRHS